MDNSSYERDRVGLTEGSSSYTPSPRHMDSVSSEGFNASQSSQSKEIAEMKQILSSDLTPNKRAIIETLISAWEAKLAITSQSIPNRVDAPMQFSVENKKTDRNMASRRYSNWNVASI